MTNYKQFSDFLEIEFSNFIAKPKLTWQSEALKYVDGFAADELRRLVDLETRRKAGAFFTNSDLANKVLSELKLSLNRNSIIYDPACGAGNLLISASNFLYKKVTLYDLKKQIFGTDIHHEFTEAAKIRLMINLLLQAKDQSILPSINSFENNIIATNGLLMNPFYEKATHIIANPPFNLLPVDDSITWTKGKASAAAIFIDKIINNVNDGTQILAILPEVLRCGSRYEKWRAMIKQSCITYKIISLGKFDKYADVDVYAISMVKQKASSIIIKNKDKVSNKYNLNFDSKVEDLFDVNIGPVVDNRDPKEGKLLNYIISKGLKGWCEIDDSTLTRSFKGKSFEGPFIVIKRTSRVGDPYRATASIINLPNPVYVDNHLIILMPKSKRIEDCWRAIQALKDERTNNWLNEQIRCRHLTVKVVSKIPLWK